MQKYDIVIYKGNGPAFRVLSWVLGLFETEWDGWGWHMGFVCSEGEDPDILEAVAGGVRRVPLSQSLGFVNGCRSYSWLEPLPDQDKAEEWITKHIGSRYDIQIYFWTVVQYLFRHFLNKRIPRMLDDRFTCWELVFEFAEDMGQPIGSKYDCPILTDFLRAAGVIRADNHKPAKLSIIKERNR